MKKIKSMAEIMAEIEAMSQQERNEKLNEIEAKNSSENGNRKKPLPTIESTLVEIEKNNEGGKLNLARR